MGRSRIWSFACGVVGFGFSSMLFIVYTTSQQTVRSKSVTALANKRHVNGLTDLEILREEKLMRRILISMDLYKQKMEFLKEKNMVYSRRGIPSCSNKIKPTLWCHDQECKKKLPPVGSSEIFQSIAKPFRFIEDGVFTRIPEVFGTDVIQKRKYVFLLAVSENHYLESQATIQTLHEKVFPHITNYTLYVYDMGLKKEQILMLQKYAKATVRTYPFHLLPPRVHLFKNFTWKAVLIQAHIDKAEFVVYSDASVRFVANLVPMFKLAEDTGFLMCSGSHALAQQTSRKMFSYYGDEPCSYSSYVEWEGGFMVFKNEPFAKTLLLEPWLACTLDHNCISGEWGFKEPTDGSKYGRRHRFDMSSMTIILVKLFRENISTFNSRKGRFHYIKQGRTNVSNYLEKLRKMSSNRLLL